MEKVKRVSPQNWVVPKLHSGLQKFLTYFRMIYRFLGSFLHTSFWSTDLLEVSYILHSDLQISWKFLTYFRMIYRFLGSFLHTSEWSTDFLEVSYILQKNPNTKQIPVSWREWTSHILDFDLSWLITNFNTVISNFCDRFQWSGTRQNSWLVSLSLLCCPLSAQWHTFSLISEVD
jgi:hypothetical protein